MLSEENKQGEKLGFEPKIPLEHFFIGSTPNSREPCGQFLKKPPTSLEEWLEYLTLESLNPQMDINRINEARRRGLKGLFTFLDCNWIINFSFEGGEIIMTLPLLTEEGKIENPVWGLNFELNGRLLLPPREIWKPEWFGDKGPLFFQQNPNEPSYSIFLKNYPYKTSSTP